MNTIRTLARGLCRFGIAVPLVLLIATGAPLLAQTPSLSDRLPASTVFFAYWHGMGAVTSAEKTNHVVQLFEDPQFVHARDSLFKSMRENIAKNGPATSDQEQAEVLSLFDNPAVVGVVLNPKSDKKPESDKRPLPIPRHLRSPDFLWCTMRTEKRPLSKSCAQRIVPLARKCLR